MLGPSVTKCTERLNSPEVCKIHQNAARQTCGPFAERNAWCHFAPPPPVHAQWSNAPDAASNSTCRSGRNISTKTQCDIFGNARRAIMPLRLPSHMNRWRH